MFAPIAPDRTKQGNRIRLYAGPQWVRPDGRNWKRIDQVISVRRIADGWEVRYGGRSIRLTSAAMNAIDAATIKARLTNRHFGPVLDPDRCPDRIDWRVAASPGVRRIKDGWVLGEPDGVKLGLFLHEWRQRFGDGLSLADDAATLNLRGAKAARRPINLDPITQDLTTAAYYMNYSVTSWEDSIGDETTSSFNANLGISASATDALNSIVRSALRFSDCPSGAAAATLHIHAGSYVNISGTDVIVSSVSLEPGILDTANYGHIYAGRSGDGSAGPLVAAGGDWYTFDLDMAAQYTQGGTTELGLSEDDHDFHPANPPAQENTVNFDDSGDDIPYLEITVGGPPGLATGTSTSTATRRPLPV